jgi:hypothetical protein
MKNKNLHCGNFLEVLDLKAVKDFIVPPKKRSVRLQIILFISTSMSHRDLIMFISVCVCVTYIVEIIECLMIFKNAWHSF